jgi:hypothetical protein
MLEGLNAFLMPSNLTMILLTRTFSSDAVEIFLKASHLRCCSAAQAQLTFK